MLLKSSFLLFAATALVAVSASPLPAGAGNAPSSFDSFPDLHSPNALKVQGDLLKLLQAQATSPATAKPTTSNPATGTPVLTTKPTGTKQPIATSKPVAKPTKTTSKPPVKPTKTASKSAVKPTQTPSKKPKNSKRATADEVVAIHKYAEFARAAYQISSKAWNCKKCTTSDNLKDTVLDYFFNNKEGPSYGYVGHNDRSKEIIVAFRGTTTISDFVADAKFGLTDWKGARNGAKVHTGFNKSYRSVGEPIKGMVLALLTTYRDYKVVFVGHSLGGAQASLAAADFVYANPKIQDRIFLYTYGQPRTGNSDFAGWMNKQPFKKYRTTYKADIISQSPPRAIGYEHHGEEIHYPISGSLVSCGERDGENPKCQNSISIAKLNLNDHSLYPGLDK
ncbi:alpha/beta-hydrolase [Martensiomyces pterosporus]|nr:alpha/beta-hydrolase [Martensiomyces pterosporus]